MRAKDQRIDIFSPAGRLSAESWGKLTPVASWPNVHVTGVSGGGTYLSHVLNNMELESADEQSATLQEELEVLSAQRLQFAADVAALRKEVAQLKADLLVRDQELAELDHENDILRVRAGYKAKPVLN